ncbi:unnamed protein product, partial [marine sediment metagenome]
QSFYKRTVSQQNQYNNLCLKFLQKFNPIIPQDYNKKWVKFYLDENGKEVVETSRLRISQRDYKTSKGNYLEAYFGISEDYESTKDAFEVKMPHMNKLFGYKLPCKDVNKMYQKTVTMFNEKYKKTLEKAYPEHWIYFWVRDYQDYYEIDYKIDKGDMYGPDESIKKKCPEDALVYKFQKNYFNITKDKATILLQPPPCF